MAATTARRRKRKVLRTSERLSFRRCPKQWEWGYLDGWKAKDEAQPLWFGTGIHEGLASYYLPGTKRGPHPRDTWLEYCDRNHEMVRLFRDEGPEYVEARDLGVHMLEGYIDMWGEEDKSWRVIQPEYKAKVHVHNGAGDYVCDYVLTCDGVVYDRDDKRNKVVEHKTAARVDVQKYQMDDQARTYPPFMSAALIAQGKIRKPITSIKYNILRKDVAKTDDRPINEHGERLNKNGTVSKQQNPQAPLFVRQDYDSTLAEQNAQIERIESEVRVMSMMERDRSLIYKNYSSDCSFCPFRLVCELHEADGEWEELMEWSFKKHDPYETYAKAA